MPFHFFSYPPCPALAPYVDAIWGVRGTAHYHVEAVVPNGATELMINFGPTQKVVAYGDQEVDQTFRQAWLAGMQERRLVHASPQGADHIAVRFRRGGAHAFFDLPMEAVANQVVDLDTLVGPEALSLRDRLGEAASDQQRVRLLERWLLGRRLAVHPCYPTIRRALDDLHGAQRTRVADLCDRLGLSNKHLIHQFRRVVGLPPKTIARVARFQAVISATKGRRQVAWGDLASHLGYADQPHLIREFRRFAGVTPTEFLRHRTPDQSHVVVA